LSAFLAVDEYLGADDLFRCPTRRSRPRERVTTAAALRRSPSTTGPSRPCRDSAPRLGQLRITQRGVDVGARAVRQSVSERVHSWWGHALIGMQDGERHPDRPPALWGEPSTGDWQSVSPILTGAPGWAARERCRNGRRCMWGACVHGQIPASILQPFATICEHSAYTAPHGPLRVRCAPYLNLCPRYMTSIALSVPLSRKTWRRWRGACRNADAADGHR